ncbi:hypothetical protein [Paludibacterium sp. B53371]|uniref:hypothetical protein n=1 Tax=Paludibacterium sp. B53371 TaxID=2806263 RepID=UPI001C0414D3|nr:hypothetical protein [Paludibacterium sp. B53371]
MTCPKTWITSLTGSALSLGFLAVLLPHLLSHLRSGDLLLTAGHLVLLALLSFTLQYHARRLWAQRP